MPRISPVSPSEKLIGSRVRELRQGHLLTGTAFAKKYGINSGNLSKYENGWVPLPWALGNKIAFIENVSQEWLATGRLPRAPYLFFEDDLLKSIPQRSLFSDAYSNYLAPRFRAADRAFRKDGKGGKLPKGLYRDVWNLSEEFLAKDQLPLFIHLATTWYNSIPTAGRSKLIQVLDKTLSEYVKNELPSIDTSEITAKAIAMYFKNRQHIEAVKNAG